jgi:hypothetical protein
VAVTVREHGLLNAEEAWYRTKAIEFSRVQISVDMFLFSANYTDIATLSQLPKSVPPPHKSRTAKADSGPVIEGPGFISP